MVINDFYAITVGHLGERSEAPEFLTCSIEMVVSIVSYNNICILHPPVMMNPVLLQGLHVQDSDFDFPHA